MARIRTVKPEFWQDEDLAEVSEPAILLAIGLLNYSDDEGYFKSHPGLIKAAVFPIREPSVSIHGMLSELSKIGYIRLGTGSDGKAYGQIVNFNKHQKISHPSPSKIKDLVEFSEYSVNTHGNLPSGKERKGTGKGKEQGTGKGTGNTTSDTFVPDDPMDENTKPHKAENVREIFEHWQQVMGHPRAILDTDRRKKINSALKLGYSAEDLKNAITGCSLSPFNMGQNENGARHDGIDLIMRNASKIDRFISFYKNPPKPVGRQAQIEAINRGVVDEFVNSDFDPFAENNDTIEGEVSHG